MSGSSNYPPGVTGADIEKFFGDEDENNTCKTCGENLNINGECDKCSTRQSGEGSSVNGE